MKSRVYIHIPFCEQRCYYCAFTVAVTSKEAFKPYVARLTREIAASGTTPDPETVYFGGGTPSLIPAECIEQLLRAIGGRPSEITLEANPGTLTRQSLERYRSAGISRISLGAQSLEDEDLKRAGRLHHAAAVFEDVELLRLCGFSNINLDLIAGLPNQDLAVWRRNLGHLAGLMPEHVSLYMLEHEERSAWSKLTDGLLQDVDFAEFYSEAEDRLDRLGYVHYEISNWAKPGFECRHNLGYWNDGPYRGFGVGAHSYDGARRFWNTTSLPEYADCIDNGRPPIAGEETLTPLLRREEAFMLGLRQASGLDVPAVSSKLGIELPEEWYARLRDLEDAGWVAYDGRTVRLTARGRLAATSVTEELLWPTPSSTFEAIP